MPVWHESTRQWRQSGDLVVLGVVQEQHPDRCRLFAQWKGIDWPLLHDPINRLGLRVVPVFVAIDEAGTVVDSNLNAGELADFLARPAATPGAKTQGSVKEKNGHVDSSGDLNRSIALMEKADREILWLDKNSQSRRSEQIDRAIKSYRSAVSAAEAGSVGELAAAHFRLGVALRMRHDSPSAQRGDFQAAVDAWGDALDADPNHYIYRRRIQQYGPRQIKPYPFYDWVASAREEIAARGETPVDLVAEPVGAEIARPAGTEQRAERQSVAPNPPDPAGKITRDTENLIDATVTVVPGQIRPGDALQVHVTLRPNRLAHWNNEAEPAMIWIDVPRGWQADPVLLESNQPDAAESREPRPFDFELRSPGNTDIDVISGYALYYVCEEKRGTCLYLRKDLKIPIRYRP